MKYFAFDICYTSGKKKKADLICGFEGRKRNPGFWVYIPPLGQSCRFLN